MPDTLLIIFWLAYFIQHSLLASLWFKQHLFSLYPALRTYYRLLYNLLSTVLLIPLVFILYRDFGALVIQWEGPWRWLSYFLSAFALIGFAVTMKYYDSADFLGFKQLKAAVRIENNRPAAGFCLSPLHRYVRHPWYFLGLIILWTRDMDINLLVSALLISVYLVIGSRMEERKLVVELGDIYQQYRSTVPGLLPLPWKYLTAAEAKELLQSGQ